MKACYSKSVKYIMQVIYSLNPTHLSKLSENSQFLFNDSHFSTLGTSIQFLVHLLENNKSDGNFQPQCNTKPYPFVGKCKKTMNYNFEYQKLSVPICSFLVNRMFSNSSIQILSPLSKTRNPAGNFQPYS